MVFLQLIFGFDSDTDTTFQETLDGLSDAALLSGDPSLLTALPGTPLYRRMNLSGRIRSAHFGLGGYKYQTNICYLLPTSSMIEGFKYFVKVFCNGGYQYRRLKNFFDLLNGGNFVPMESKGFGNLGLFLKMVVTNRAAFWQMTQRIIRFGAQPANLFWAIKGLILAVTNRDKGGLGYFQFWFFAWTNAILKYRYISNSEFDIESVPQDFDIKEVLPEGYEDAVDEPIPPQKIRAQQRATVAQLKMIIASRT